MSFGTAQAFYVALQAVLGSFDYQSQPIINSVTPTTQTAATYAQLPVNLAANGSQSINLAATFPALTNVQFVCIQDVTANGGQTFVCNGVTIAAGFWMAWMQGGGNPPVVTLSNPNGSAGNILISVASL